MRRHSILAICAVTVSLSSAGCGRTEGLYPVSGKVLYQGRPAVGATVFFHRNGGPSGPVPNAVPTGVVGEDGSFRLLSDVADGAPSGKYNILITWRDHSSHAEQAPAVSRPASGKGIHKASRTALKIKPSASLPSDRLNGRYANPDHPLLTADVRPASNTIPPFELTD
jgi:hypothetical protein